MKNAVFKHGAKRNNFHNPPKNVANFWCLQSDWELQNLKSRSACSSEDAIVIVSDVASAFNDSEFVRLLLAHKHALVTTQLDFLQSVKFHGVRIRRADHVLFEQSVYLVSRVCRVGCSHYLMLHLCARELEVDHLGAYYCDPQRYSQWRLLSLSPQAGVTGLWAICQPSGRVSLVPKF